VRLQDAELIAQLEAALPDYRCRYSLARDPNERPGALKFRTLDEDCEGRLVIAELFALGLAVFTCMRSMAPASLL